MKYYNSNLNKGGLLNLNEALGDQLKKIKAPEIELDSKTILSETIKKWLESFKSSASADTLVVVSEIDSWTDKLTTVKDILSKDFSPEALNAIKALVKAGRVREIPLFWSYDELKESLKKPRPIDYYVYDLGSKEGRDKAANKFLPICKKLALSYAFKNAGHTTKNIADSDLFGAAMEGLATALYNYGRSRDEYVRTSDNSWKADDDKEYKIVNAGSLPAYISWMVRNSILDYLNDEDKLVRVPRSENARVRQATGANVTQSNASGDDTVGSDDDARTKFDTMTDDTSSAAEDTNASDLKSIEQDIFKLVKNKFGEAALKLWQEKYGLGGVEPRDKKKNPYGPNDYYRLKTVEKFVKTDPAVLKLLKDLYND